MLKLFSVLTFVFLHVSFVLAQGFEITPPNLDFSSVVVGSNSTLQATVTNPDAIDPDASAPVEVRDDETTEEPKVVAFRTDAELI